MIKQSLIVKVSEQAKRGAEEVKNVDNEQFEVMFNVAFLILLQIGIFKFFVL